MPWKNKKQQLKYQRAWVAARRTKWLAENGPCKKCGSSEDLQVDHIDPKEKVSHRVFSWSNGRREAELAKCQVLCKKCHKKKSVAEGSVPAIRHGTRSRYLVGRCRCPECVSWNTENMKKKRMRRRARMEMNQSLSS